MEYMFQKGFLGTKAPLFMDEVTLLVALLPLLLAIGIFLAKKKRYKLHAYYQIVLYALSVAAVVYFELGVRSVGGFGVYLQHSTINHPYFFAVLVLHIAIASSTILFWSFTIFSANKEVRLGKHRRDGILTAAGIALTSLTGVWVYLLLFT